MVHAADTETDEVWMVSQEFIKFGKKEIYEHLKSSMMQKWSLLKKNGDVGMTVGLEELNEPQYLYLTPLKDYAGIDRLMDLHRSAVKAWTPDERTTFTFGFDSTLNFKIRTLMRYRHTCSFVPDENCNIRNLPWVHYLILTLKPGTAEHLEKRLEDLAAKQRSAEVSLCWRTWEVTFGGETSQFVVAFFGVDPTTLHERAEHLGLVNSAMKEILLREKKGTAHYRPDLSVVN